MCRSTIKLCPSVLLVILLLVGAAPPATAQQASESLQPTSPWQIVLPPTLSTMYTVSMVSPTDVWASGVAGITFHWNGTEWLPVLTEFSDPVRGIDMVNATLGFGVTFMGKIVVCDGTTWTEHSAPAAAPLNRVEMVSATDGWAVGGIDPNTSQGTILRWNGSQWNLVPSGVTAWLKDVDMVSPTDGWVVGIGVMSHWTGATWNSANLGAVSLYGVSAPAPNDVWAVGAGGVIYHYDGSMHAVPSPTTKDLNAIHMVSSDEGWAVGADGIILHYTGGEWVVVPSPLTNDLNDIDMQSPTEGWIVGRMGAFLKYVAQPDLSTSRMTVAPRQAMPANVVEFTVDVVNSGLSPAASVVVTDVIPTNLAYVPGTATTTQGSVTVAGPLVAIVGDVAPGSTVTVRFQATVADLGTTCGFVANGATIRSNTELIPLQAIVTVGECRAVYLPLVGRSVTPAAR